MGGAAAAVAAGTSADRLLAAHDDETLRLAAVDLLDEVREEVEEEWDDHPTLAITRSFGAAEDDATARSVYDRALLDEWDEVEHLPAAHARLDGAGGYLAGDRELAAVPPGTCDDAVIAGSSLRACGVGSGAARLTLAMASGAADARKALLGWSVLVGVLIGASLGGAASYRASVWALAPLRALAEQVRQVDTANPRPEVLGGALIHAELEDVRASVANLVMQLGEALSTAQGFAALAAHELRTPLASLVGELELLSEASSPDATASIDVARRRVADLVGLVQRLLILAQPDSVANDEADAVDLGDVLEATLATLAPNQRERVRATADDDVLVRGDSALLVSLLSNAVENALRFSHDDVAVRIACDGDDVTLAVEDRGPGIPAGERERVFEPFYRSRAARQSATLGHGVGLALIAHVARAHGGSTSLGSASPMGTVLVARLPAWRPRARTDTR
ncbi:MAG: HAMP domain-containing histidine kinase [Sandaracinaceae bacterium]|nr:HAMP domain-containing histidine kinase [Myxococcales bacterium]MCB9657724.1 HAMP domain-containing histidine kinase [Sandaracinaceae bacterium]